MPIISFDEFMCEQDDYLNDYVFFLFLMISLSTLLLFLSFGTAGPSNASIFFLLCIQACPSNVRSNYVALLAPLGVWVPSHKGLILFKILGKVSFGVQTNGFLGLHA